MWDLSSLTRDRTLALGSDSPESQPLDLQGIPQPLFLQVRFLPFSFSFWKPYNANVSLFDVAP